MIMKLDLIKANIENRLKALEAIQERDFPLLHTALGLPNQLCYEVFQVGNENLEDVEYLNSMLVNCFLDDSELHIYRRESDASKEHNQWEEDCAAQNDLPKSERIILWDYELKWHTNDNKRPVTQEALMKVINAKVVALEYLAATEDAQNSFGAEWEHQMELDGLVDVAWEEMWLSSTYK
jgi:hypothetical protein